MGFGFDIMFTLVPIASLAIFGLTFGLMIATLVRRGREEKRNDLSPRLTVDAKVIAKRSDIHRNRHSRAGDSYYTTATTYFVTFQFASGDRMELKLQGPEYGLLIEGDEGKLTFQGTRYLGFARS